MIGILEFVVFERSVVLFGNGIGTRYKTRNTLDKFVL